MKEIKRYYNNGKLCEQYCINENKNIEHEYSYWYDNGHIWEHCFCKDGMRSGEYKRWNKSGDLRQHVFYHNNKQVDISEYVTDINNITEEEYFHLQLVFGYFPIIKFDGELQ